MMIVSRIGIVTLALVTAISVSTAEGAEKLLKDGQKVILTVTTGAKKHDYVHTYREGKHEFGPTRVIAHDADSLTFRGRTDTCEIFKGGTLRCMKTGSGTWKLQ